MSNVTVQEALKKLIEYVESTASFIPTEYDHIGINVVNTGKAALVEIDKCEPVARFVSKRLTPEGTQEFFGFLLVDSIPPLSLLYTSPQPRDWVGLTDKRIEEIAKLNGAWQLYSSLKIFDFVANINDELKQLNTKG